jgi:hypothetical protein
MLASILGFAGAFAAGESVIEAGYGAITGAVLVWLLRQAINEESNPLQEAT